MPNGVQKVNLEIDGNAIERVKSVKFLGVFIDERLNWSEHINYVSLNISKTLGILYRVKNILPNNVLLMLYNSMIYPYLTYCNIAWGCAKPTVLQKLILLQKRALRFITRSSYCSSTKPLFFRLGLLRLEDIHRLQIAIFMLKFKYKL